MQDGRKIRVLFGKPGLDGHDVGAKVVARAMMDAGFDVIYTGLRKSPEAILQMAREHKVDVIGLSILSGSHLPICRRFKALLQEHGPEGVLWIVGGNIPARDHQKLEELGVDAVFAVGTSPQAAIDYIREHVQ